MPVRETVSVAARGPYDGNRMAAIRDYPWAALERVPKRSVSGLRAARERWTRTFAPEALAAALAELAGVEVDIRIEALGVGAFPSHLPEATLEAEGVRVTVGAEPALVFELVQKVLGRPFALRRTEGPLEPALVGAFAAFVLEAGRRVADQPLVLGAKRVEEDDALAVRVVVKVDGRPYTAHALVGGARPVTALQERASLLGLADVLLPVPLVIGLSLVARAELERLGVGWAFVPGDGLFIDANGRGFGALAAATAERGVRVELGASSGIVLREETLALAPDLDTTGDAMDEANDVNQTLADAVLEAPVVVRIELGAVSLTAADWAKLRPGDVIETGRRIAEPVVLRVGGRVVARGELVDVEGELGVRVRELAGTPPE